MSDIRLVDLINVNTLQEIQDGFAELTGMAAITTDSDGTPVTRGSNFSDFCMNYMRKSPLGCSRCEKCDRDGAEQTLRTGEAAAYFCHSGLVDFAAPIMCNGEIVGSFIGGQVLTEEPDLEKFRNDAETYGYDPDEYVEAVQKVKIRDKEYIDSAAAFIKKIADVLSETAYNSYSAAKAISEVNSGRDLVEKITASEALIRENKDAMEKLVDSFVKLQATAASSVAEVNATSDTVKVIRDIALNTKILGFNASIEASRAKESGRGFGVIAQEVRNLAETSKTSADKIQGNMQKIKEYTGSVSDNVSETKAVLNYCMENLTHFAELLDDIQRLSDK